MKITQQELIEFADQQGLTIFGKGKIITSKIRAIQRLINKGLIPKPIWKGGTSVAYWENDIEIKDRILWLDEQREKGKSYKKIQFQLNAPSLSSDALKEIEPILKHVDTLIEIHPSISDNYYIKAKLYEKIGYYEQALDIYRDILLKNEDDTTYIPLLFESIINIYHLKNQKEEEKKYCEKYIEFSKAKGGDILGNAYLSMGDYYNDINTEFARQYYEKAEKFITNKTKLGYLYGSVYKVEKWAKNFKKAKNYLNKSIEILPDHSIDQAISKTNYAIMYYDEGDYDNALKYFLEVKEVFRHYNDIFNEALVTSNIGMIYKKRGNYKKALNMFRFAINNLDSNNKPVEYKMQLQQLSEIYKLMGHERKSKFYEEEEKKIKVTYLSYNKENDSITKEH